VLFDFQKTVAVIRTTSPRHDRAYRFGVESGQHVLAVSISPFDPKRTLRDRPPLTDATVQAAMDHLSECALPSDNGEALLQS
jgi:hypothetical protein